MRGLTFVALVAIGACGNDGGKGGGKGGDHDDPGLLGYAKRSKKTEGELQIDNLEGLSRKYFYKNNDTFPTITIGPTPAKSCCDFPDHMCPPQASDWIGTDWDQLHFKMTDRPFRFQYSYVSDGKTVTATASADLDCDPTNGATTLVTVGTIVSGEPVFTRTRSEEK